METPLLDRRQPLPPGPKNRRTLRLALGAVLGAALELAGFRFGWFDQLGQVCLAFFPMYYVVIFIHEFGHLVAAQLVGFRFREFAAGPLIVRSEADGLDWRFVPGRLFAGGQVQAVPESSTDLRRRFLILLAGGPIATAIVFAVLPFLPGGAWTRAVLVANLLTAATSWLPFYAAGYVTDAKGILLLGRGRAEGDLLLAMLDALALDSQGVRPRDWDPGTLTRLRERGESGLSTAAAVLTLAHAFDVRDPGDLGDAVERALGQAMRGVALHRRMIFESAAYAQGVYRRNTELAAAWLDDARKVKGIVAEADWDADAQGAVALAAGDLEKARHEFIRAMTRLDRRPGRSGSVDASRDRLWELIQLCAGAEARQRTPYGSTS